MARDMLVNLTSLPPMIGPIEGVTIRRALASERESASAWMLSMHNRSWHRQSDQAFDNNPIKAFVAVDAANKIIGFGAYDSTAMNIFGPTAVDEAWRGKRIGTAILLACLYEMRENGFKYAIIGMAGPQDYYKKAVGATPI